MDDYDAWGALGNPGWSWENMLPYFKKVTCVPSQHSRLVGNRELTSCVHARPKPSPRQVLHWPPLATFRGMTRSGVTPVRCSTRTRTTFTREVVSEPESEALFRDWDADLIPANWWNAANEVGLPPVNDPLGGSKQGESPVSEATSEKH